MSVIHEALKKAESGIAASKIKDSKKPRFKLNVYFFAIPIIFIGVFLASVFFKFFSPSSADSKKTVVLNAGAAVGKALTQAEPKNQDESTEIIGKIPSNKDNVTTEPQKDKSTLTLNFVLNGIFFSQEQGYALINNRIVKEGDIIDGATVEKITPNSAELKTEAGPLTLSTAK